MSGPALVSTGDAAALAGVSPAAIRQWKRRGLLVPRGRRGRSTLWAADEVLEAERLAWERDDTGRTDQRS